MISKNKIDIDGNGSFYTVAERVRYICDHVYGGDRQEMARVTQTSAGVLRDIFRGKRLPNDVIESVVNKVSLFRNVSSNWLKKGVGEPIRRHALIGGYELPVEHANEKPEPVTDKAPVAPVPNKEMTSMNSSVTSNGHHSGPKSDTSVAVASAASSFDLFAEFARRLGQVEADLKLTLDVVQKASAAQPDVEDVISKVESRLRTSVTQMAAEANGKMAVLERTAGRHESAMVAMRTDLDKLKAELFELQDAATGGHAKSAKAVGAKQKGQDKKQDELSLSDDDTMIVSEYLLLPGVVPDQLRASGVTWRSLVQFLSVYEIAKGIKTPKVDSHGPAGHTARLLYKIRSYRAFHEHLAAKGYNLSLCRVREFVADW